MRYKCPTNYGCRFSDASEDFEPKPSCSGMNEVKAHEKKAVDVKKEVVDVKTGEHEEAVDYTTA